MKPLTLHSRDADHCRAVRRISDLSQIFTDAVERVVETETLLATLKGRKREAPAIKLSAEEQFQSSILQSAKRAVEEAGPAADESGQQWMARLNLITMQCRNILAGAIIRDMGEEKAAAFIHDSSPGMAGQNLAAAESLAMLEEYGQDNLLRLAKRAAQFQPQ